MAGTISLLFLFQSTISAFLFYQINSKQPEPYIDEIFHVPQAANYCLGNFSHWDPKITTLPGLYIASLLILKPISLILGQDLSNICSVTWLRSVNVFFSMGNVILLWKILEHDRDDSKTKSKAHKSKTKDVADSIHIYLEAFAVSNFPLLYFLSFLYYTDAGSLFFVLASYSASRRDCHGFAAALGFCSIVFRQTNIIWILFIAGEAVFKFLEENDFIAKSGNAVDLIYNFISSIFKNFFSILKLTAGYVVVCIIFVVFVIVNKGIVVGDRSSHVASFNVPQLFYFAAFTLVFASPFLITINLIKTFLKKIGCSLLSPKRLCVIVFLMVIMAFAISKLTYVHPYLLADNRHYPFYVWKKVYERHWSIRYLLIPCYMYAGWSINQCLKNKGLLWLTLFYCCTSLVLIPQQLFEFRYFIIPYMIFRINLEQPSVNLLLCELFLYISVNAFTFHMFLFRPFYWHHEKSLQRFMW